MLPSPSTTLLRVAPLGRDREAAGRVHLGMVVAVVVVVLVLAWLFAPRGPVVTVLGPAERLITRDGVATFVVGRPGGVWEVLDDTASAEDTGRALLTDVVGRPAIHPSGDVVLLTSVGLQCWSDGGLTLLCERAALPDDARLSGVAGDALIVLQHDFVDGSHRLSTARFEGGSLQPLVPLVHSGGAPVVVSAEAGLLVSRFGAAVAFRGEDGWEAWTFAPVGLDDPGKAPGPRAAGAHASQDSPARVVAEGLSTQAVFAPDGVHLVVEDPLPPVGSLKLLSMKDGGLAFMSHGNLGHSRRVPDSHAFRGDPVLLVNPRWHRNDHLQIFSHHFLGGGQLQFKIAFLHHYAVSISEDGRWMSYCQSDFDEDGDDAFVEDLYVLDFGEPSRGASHLGRRAGGRADVGPRFIGSRPVLVSVMDGELQLVRLAETESP